jgi:hypothetical protein
MNRLRIFCFVYLFVASASALWAQEVTASITGTLTDPTGAVMPGVRVVATQVSTNISRNAETGPTGDYLIPLLQPGTYTLRISHEGFKSYVREDIVLQVNQRQRVDVALQPGVVTERMEVHAELPVVNTENAAVGKVIDNQSIALMPLNGRLSIAGLLALAPGMQNIGASQDSIPAYGITPTVSGAPSMGAINWTVDGTRNIPPNIARGLGDWPPLEGIQEFKVITSGASAEFDTANQVVVVTRGGSNQIHGTALAVNRNRFLAAKNFFATQLPLPQYNRNEFGATISGPVFIPNVYNGKNKTFFFFNYDGYRRNQAKTVSSSVFTSAMRQGDFAGVADKNGPIYIQDPYSGAPFPNNKIPSSRFSPVTQTLMGLLFPLPNTAGTGPAGMGINLIENIPIREHVNRWSARIDHSFSERDQLSGGVMIVNLGPNMAAGTTSMAGGSKYIGDLNRNAFASWNHSFSPRTINELRAGYLYIAILRVAQNVDMPPVGSIIPGLGDQAINGAPVLSFTNFAATGEGGGHDRDHIGSLSDNLVLVRGKHTMKAGGMFSWGHQNNLNEITPYRGQFIFNGQVTGYDGADFMLGWPATAARGLPGWKSTANRDMRSAFFFQDDWNITRNVTINLGIRYEFVPEKEEARGQASMFIPSRGNNVVFGDAYPAITQQRLVTLYNIPLSKDVGLPTNVADYVGNDTNNFAPRIGVAWRVGPSTVIRSGTGLYYVALAGGLLGGLSSQLPFVSNETIEQGKAPGTGTPTLSMSNPFPSDGKLPSNPTSQFQTKFVTPYMIQWNFTIEHKAPWDTGLRIGYYGQRCVKLHGTWNVNDPTPAPGTVQSRRPYQPFAGINGYYLPMFQNTSHALQGGIQKRYSHGLLVSTEYQFTHAIGTESYMSQSPNWNDSRGNLNNVRKHNFTAAYVYDLPMGKGRAAFSNASGPLQLIAGGWQLSGIVSAMSGAPFSPSFSTTVQGSVGVRPDVVPGASFYPATRTITNYFNAGAFTKPAEFTYGNASYNLLWGPGRWTWDTSLLKNFSLRERATLQLSLSAFSILNHPMFDLPGTNIISSSTVGRITTSSGERTIQIGAKLSF